MGKLPMLDLIRLVYISRANLVDQGEEHMQAVNQEILSKAHTFNQENHITGILCFDNGCYLQLLEGAKCAVEMLYAKIAQDPRHKDVKLIFKEPISERSFAHWHMKKVEDIHVTMPLIRMHGHKHFSPFEFAENLFKDLIDFLSQKCKECKI
jgi:hypothetical protein